MTTMTIDYAVTNPATGEQLKVYPTITDAELDAAIGLAYETHRNWLRSSSVEERAELVRRVGELHTERREQLAEITVREMGKPTEQALGEIDFCADIYGYYADNGPDLMKDEPIKLLAGEGSAIIRRSSLGVILGIMPWNFPTYQVARFAGPGLIIGNAVLLKHAPQCPETAEALQAIYLEAGFPEGAYVNIYATNDQIASVIADPRVQGVSVTGSERAGAAVAEIAGRNLKKVVLELGGSDPFILLSTDDLDATVESAVNARLDNAGQSCNAAKRFVVIDELYEPFLEKFTAAMTAWKTGDPAAEGTELGPLSSSTPRRSAAGSARPCDQGRRQGRRRRRARRQLLLADGAGRRHARQRRLPRGAVRAGRGRLQGRLRGRGGASSRTTRRSGWAPTSSRPTPSRPSGSPTRSTPAWSTSTSSGPTVPSCRSAASSGPARGASSGSTALTSS